MIFDATGIEGLTQRLWELGVCAAATKFVERPVREQEERAVYGDVPDLNRLRRWLRGDATARFDACGVGPDCHLVSAEFLNGDGLAMVLDRYREERPDIRVLVYDPHLRVAPEVPFADQIVATKCGASPFRGVGIPNVVHAPEFYVMGFPAGPVGQRDPSRVNEDWTLADLPGFIGFNRNAMVARFGEAAVKAKAPCIHERYHPGRRLHGGISMSLDVWRVYVGLMLDQWEHLTWWSSHAWDGTKYIPQTLEDVEGYVQVLAGECLRRRKGGEAA